MTSDGGRSQGTVLIKVIMTPMRRSTPMLWFPDRVPSHILMKTYTIIQRDTQIPNRANEITTRDHVRPIKDS